ncbi:MAG: NADH:ubiquinone reductase (Na(+)-transporting) subunit A [Chlamydiales bacterium]
MNLHSKKGLCIPIGGNPENLEIQEASISSHIALDLTSFTPTIRLLIKKGDEVLLGEPIAEEREFGERKFVSPAGGVVTDIIRGEKRKPLYIVIEVSKKEREYKHKRINIEKCTVEEILSLFLESGVFTKIYQRPYNILASPKRLPQAIFVIGAASAPYVPSPILHITGYEEWFQLGLNLLSRIAAVHLTHNGEKSFFPKTDNVYQHTVSGPHPAANVSFAIYHINPIITATDLVWTIQACDVIAIGKLAIHGTLHYLRVISVAGDAIRPECRTLLRVREGINIGHIIKNRLDKGNIRVISGDPLIGRQVTEKEFLGMFHYVVCAIYERPKKRKMFSFLRFGKQTFTATRVYLSGFYRNHSYPFTTNQHGEERAFVDASIYDKVMPMRIPTMHLVKAILVKDFELAEQLGLLEIAEEDFALAAFICPSKIDIVQIVKNGLITASQMRVLT